MHESFGAVLAHPALALILWIALFVQIYVFCTAIINICLRSRKLSWMVGRWPVSARLIDLKRFSFPREDSAGQESGTIDLVLKAS